MPIDEDLRRYTAPPSPIGTEPDDHDPNDDRHDEDDFSEWETTEPEPTWKENIINNIL